MAIVPIGVVISKPLSVLAELGDWGSSAPPSFDGLLSKTTLHPLPRTFMRSMTYESWANDHSEQDGERVGSAEA
jgi:hypothetical protein